MYALYIVGYINATITRKDKWNRVKSTSSFQLNLNILKIKSKKKKNENYKSNLWNKATN